MLEYYAFWAPKFGDYKQVAPPGKSTEWRNIGISFEASSSFVGLRWKNFFVGKSQIASTLSSLSPFPICPTPKVFWVPLDKHTNSKFAIRVSCLESTGNEFQSQKSDQCCRTHWVHDEWTCCCQSKVRRDYLSVKLIVQCCILKYQLVFSDFESNTLSYKLGRKSNFVLFMLHCVDFYDKSEFISTNFECLFRGNSFGLTENRFRMQ